MSDYDPVLVGLALFVVAFFALLHWLDAMSCAAERDERRRNVIKLGNVTMSLPWPVKAYMNGIRLGDYLSITETEFDVRLVCQVSAETVSELGTWGPKLYQQMKAMPELKDVTTDQQNGGLQMLLNYDRRTAARL